MRNFTGMCKEIRESHPVQPFKTKRRSIRKAAPLSYSKIVTQPKTGSTSGFFIFYPYSNAETLLQEDIYMSIKIAITNEKGGCGKTTSAVNISAILAERGYRVLLADVDPQSYATMYYGLYDADDPSLYDAITGVWPVNDAIVKTVFGVDVLKSNTKSMRLEEMLTEYKLRGRAYNDLLSKLLTPIENDYDYIIIDCPPQGYKLLENVQRYADYILIPMIPDEFALHSLRIKAESLIEIRRTINPHLRLLGGLIIMDEKNGTKAIYRDALQSQDVIPFFSATVRKNITLSRAINAHEPINTYAKHCNGNIDYQAVVNEIIGRVEK